jgi:hypothetical protein
MDNVITQIAASIEKREGGGDRRALHEALQRVALAGMYRSGFFERAAFYGGTCLRMRESEKTENGFDDKDMRTALNEKIRALDIEQAREEVHPFVRNPEVLKIWSKEYFLELAKRLKIAH